MATPMPICWTLWGSRRDAWIQYNKYIMPIPRDLFGFTVEYNTMVVTPGWPRMSALDHMKVSVQQVYYPHACHNQHRARLHMVDDDSDCDDCELQSVVSVRAVLHFVHLWQRKAKIKMMLRRHAQHVLLLLWKTHLPDSIGYRIYACFISQPRFARSQTHCQLARLAQRQVKQPRHALAFGTRAPHTFDLNEMD